MTYNGRLPMREEVFGMMKEKPRLLERDSPFKRVSQAVTGVYRWYVSVQLTGEVNKACEAICVGS